MEFTRSTIHNLNFMFPCTVLERLILVLTTTALFVVYLEIYRHDNKMEDYSFLWNVSKYYLPFMAFRRLISAACVDQFSMPQ